MKSEGDCKENNAKGLNQLEDFAQLDIVPVSEGNVSIFRKEGSASIVDLTFISLALMRCMSWHVSEDYTHRQLTSN